MTGAFALTDTALSPGHYVLKLPELRHATLRRPLFALVYLSDFPITGHTGDLPMFNMKRTIATTTIALMMVMPIASSSATSLPEGAFEIANMAPPEPDPTIPPDVVPPAAPDQLPNEGAPPAPETPTPPAEVSPEAAELPSSPSAEAPASGGGMGIGAIIAIIVAIGTAIIAGTWIARRK